MFDKDKCIGCVSYQILNKDLAYGVFRKLNSDYDYIAQYMQYFQATKLKDAGVRFLNDAYDSDDSGLRSLKSGFKPVTAMKLYNLSLIGG